MRPKLTYANAMSTLCFFLLLGGGAYAAGHLRKNSVGARQLKKNAVTTAKVRKHAITAAKVKDGALTGKQINASTLGTVPMANAANAAHTANTANTALTANSLAPPENWHLVGAPGEPGFQNSWHNFGGTWATAAFYKDHDGIVHLKGYVGGGTGAAVFQLPPGYRSAERLYFPIECDGGGCSLSGDGFADVLGSNASPEEAGVVLVIGEYASLSGIDFRAES